MATRPSVAWLPLGTAVGIGAVVTGLVFWRFALQALDVQIADKRAALKKLTLSGQIPPTQDVANYLTTRQTAVETHYQQWLEVVSATAPAEAAVVDPQLYVQEQFHHVNETLEDAWRWGRLNG